MIEFLSSNIAEILVTVLVFCVSGLWATLSRGFSDLKNDIETRKVMWDEEMIKINHSFEELMGDHRDIKRNLEDIKHELGDKVEKIMNDHASHERDQAVQLEILRDLKEMSRKGT